MFCKGVNPCGPFWDHVLNYWKSSLENPEKVFFSTYEELQNDKIYVVRRLGEFLGFSFSAEEEDSGMVDVIVKLCSFESLSKMKEKWTFISDKKKGLIEAFKTVLPNVDYRFCVRKNLHENFKREGLKRHTFMVALWTTATASAIQYFNYAMEKMKKITVNAFDWFGDKDPKMWSRAHFSIIPKCDILLNNICEVFNAFILDARDKLVLTMMNIVKDLIMMRMQVNRKKAEKWEGTLCPKPRARLLHNIEEVAGCMPMKYDRTRFQVYSGSTLN
ncbi:hypothetical protein LIER_39191 [Lithospermum erythrorhizon]|uniref:Sulfotransferase n=1 Tax=Lithospermum erythrorhizon TaxID=34254 RepID=A0AAV3QF98_LITER